MEIFNHPTSYICALEAHGYSLCFAAYAQYCAGEDIIQIGFNPNSGYVYIALENGITICSCVGNEPEYVVTNFDSGEESFFDSYLEAEEFYKVVNN